MRRALLLALLLFVLWPDLVAAQVPDIIKLADGVEVAERSSNPARLYGTDGAALHMNTGAILGLRDVQMGWWDPRVPSLVNGDIGAGSAEHPGILNIGADVSRKVRLQARKHTVLETRPTGVDVIGSLRICNPLCVDLAQALRRTQTRLTRLKLRVARLARAVRRLR